MKSSLLRITATVLVGLCAGFLVWLLSPVFGGAVEPWDADVPYYSVILFIGGFCCGLIGGKWFFLGVFAVYLGQMLYIEMIYEPSLPKADPQIFPAFAAVAIFGMIQPLAGAFFGFFASPLLTRYLPRRHS